MKKFTFLMAALMIAAVSMATPMTGTYKVGTAEVSPNYTSLSAAVTDINTNGVGGDIVLEISSDITEPANIGLGVNTGTFSITIRPDADVDRTITFTQLGDNSSPSGHFVIGYTSLSTAWSDANTIATSNVTIDGYAVGGTTKRLKFVNLNAAEINARILVVVGACHNTVIKNCIVINNTTNTGSPVCIVAIVRKGTAIEVAPTNLTIDNNTLTATVSGVGMGMRITNSGTLVAIPKISGFVFKNNIVTASRRLIELSYLDGITEVNNNTFNLLQSTAPGALVYGVYGNLNLLGTVNLYNNKFNQSTVVETAASGAFGIRLVQLASGPTAWNVYNNTFTGMNRTQTTGAATLNLSYIQVSFGVANIYNNSFYLPALTSPSSAGYYNAINNSNGQSQKIVNNIFVSNEPTAVHAFVSNVCTGESNCNVYYIRQTNANAKIVSAYATLNDYQTANVTMDVKSKNVDINFIDAANGDLRITGASIQDDNISVDRLASVLTDMFGTTRGSKTYAGAHEGTAYLVSSVKDVELTSRIMRTSTGIQVELDGEALIELFSVNGIMIEKKTVSGTYSHDLNKGIYIIRINGKATKFIK